MFEFFKQPIQNIFINASEKKRLDVGKGSVDYILSRSLYANIPTSDTSYSDFVMGNYCIKPYIDTLQATSQHLACAHLARNLTQIWTHSLQEVRQHSQKYIGRL